jgi:hypothetical protein
MQGRSFFSTACASLAGSAATYSQARKAAITAAAAALERMTALHTTVRIATFHRAASTRCGAFAAERRIVAGDEGGCVSGTPSASVPVLTAPARTDVGRWRALRFPRLVPEQRMLASPSAFSSPHSVALRPRVAARRWRSTKAAGTNAQGSSSSLGQCGSAAATKLELDGQRLASHRRASWLATQRAMYIPSLVPVVANGSSSRRAIRCARLDLERITPSPRCRAHRHLRPRYGTFVNRGNLRRID